MRKMAWTWLVVVGLLVGAALPALAADQPAQVSPCEPVQSAGRGLQREAFLPPVDLFSYLQTVRFLSSVGTDGVVTYVSADQPFGHIRISPLPVDRGEIKVAASISRFSIDSQQCLSLNLGILDMPVHLYFRDQAGREFLVPQIQVELPAVRVIPAFAGAEVVLRVQAVTVIDGALAALQDAAAGRARIEVVPTGLVVLFYRDRENKFLIRALRIFGLDAEVIPIAPSPFGPPSDGHETAQ